MLFLKEQKKENTKNMSDLFCYVRDINHQVGCVHKKEMTLTCFRVGDDRLQTLIVKLLLRFDIGFG
jgi:hypothetical protein